MPCVVESGLEAREADSFEYRRAALDRLRDRGLLSEREHRRKLARARSRLAELERARAAEEAARARAAEAAAAERRGAADAERARERLRSASYGVDHLPSLWFAAVVIQKTWRGVLCRVVAKAIVIQKYWRGCFTRKTARRQRVAAQAIVIQKYWRGAATRRRPRRALRAGARSVAAARSFRGL